MKILLAVLIILLPTQLFARGCDHYVAKDGSELYFLEGSKVLGSSHTAFVVIQKTGTGALHYIPSAGTENPSVKAIELSTDKLVSIEFKDASFLINDLLYRPDCK